MLAQKLLTILWASFIMLLLPSGDGITVKPKSLLVFAFEDQALGERFLREVFLSFFFNLKYLLQDPELKFL